MSFFVWFFGSLICALPFLPSILEVFRKTDVSPLVVSNQLLDDPRAEPSYLFWHLAQLLGVPSPAHLRELTDSHVKHSEVELHFHARLEKSSDQVGRYLAPSSLQIAAHSQHLSKIFSAQSIMAAENCAFNEVHALESLDLGPQNRVLWWASGKQVRVGAQARLPGKVQASQSITLSGSAEFHFLQAPIIQSEKPPLTQTVSLPRGKKTRRVCAEDFAIKAQESLSETLVVKGNFRMEENAELLGDLKVHGQVILKAGARVHGNLVCLKSVSLERDNFVQGSLLVENQLDLGPGSIVGSPDRLVSVTAKEVRILGAFKVHGLLRAWKSGRASSDQS